MSSIMRRRNGLASTDLVEVMGGSGPEVGVLRPLDPQASLPARHLTPTSMMPSTLPNPPLRAQRAPAFVLWPKPPVRGNAAPRLLWKEKRTVVGRGRHSRS